jgi:DNA polymerase elongation subunit (family B)
VYIRAHEQKATAVLQMMTERGLPATGWVCFPLHTPPVTDKEKLTACDEEYVVSYRDLMAPRKPRDLVPEGKVMAFDIECYASEDGTLPTPEKPADAIFQISCVFSSTDLPTTRHIITLGDADPMMASGGGKKPCVVHRACDEADLLIRFRDLILLERPVAMTGYNVLKFDLPYIMKRAVRFGADPAPGSDVCRESFSLDEDRGLAKTDAVQGSSVPQATRLACVARKVPADFFCLGFPLRIPATARSIKWKSNAFGEQTFDVLEMEGVVWLDMLPIVQREFSGLENFKLQTVATKFVGEGKDPVTPRDLFEAYRVAVLNLPPRLPVTLEGACCVEHSVRSTQPKTKTPNCVACSAAFLGVVARYCIQDSELCLQIMGKLNTWVGLAEMSAVCSVGMFNLYAMGQQIRVFSQVYRSCHGDTDLPASHRVVQQNVYRAVKGEKFQGAYVKLPTPGLYKFVLPMDFASLYPTSMIAHNISWNSWIPDTVRGSPNPVAARVPDEMCHVIEWDDHTACDHAKEDFAQGSKCASSVRRKYRFIKETMMKGATIEEPCLGVMAQVLLGFLRKRKAVRGEIEKLSAEMEAISGPETTRANEEAVAAIRSKIAVLNARQLAYKVSANSAYGSMGVSSGYLPFMVGAMCTTAVGRMAFVKVEDILTIEFKGRVIYGDTDSNLVILPKLLTIQENWDMGELVADVISKRFPDPMKLEFEKAVYVDFLILTKKQYMYRKASSRDGVPSEDPKDIGSRGVVLQRRDKSHILHVVYREIAWRILTHNLSARETGTGDDEFDAAQLVVENFKRVMYDFSYENFGLTRRVKRGGERQPDGSFEPVAVPGKPDKVQVGAYQVNRLPDDARKRAEKLRVAKCSNDSEYYLQSVPAAQTVLAQRMHDRGEDVFPGDRLSFLVTRGLDGTENYKKKLSRKIESVSYFCRHAEYLKIDRMFYLASFVPPLTQIFSAVKTNLADAGVHVNANYVLSVFKLFEAKEKACAQIRSLSAPTIRVFHCDEDAAMKTKSPHSVAKKPTTRDRSLAPTANFMVSLFQATKKEEGTRKRAASPVLHSAKKPATLQSFFPVVCASSSRLLASEDLDPLVVDARMVPHREGYLIELDPDHPNPLPVVEAVAALLRKTSRVFWGLPGGEEGEGQLSIRASGDFGPLQELGGGRWRLEHPSRAFPDAYHARRVCTLVATFANTKVKTNARVFPDTRVFLPTSTGTIRPAIATVARLFPADKAYFSEIPVDYSEVCIDIYRDERKEGAAQAKESTHFCFGGRWDVRNGGTFWRSCDFFHDAKDSEIKSARLIGVLCAAKTPPPHPEMPSEVWKLPVHLRHAIGSCFPKKTDNPRNRSREACERVGGRVVPGSNARVPALCCPCNDHRRNGGRITSKFLDAKPTLVARVFLPRSRLHPDIRSGGGDYQKSAGPFSASVDASGNLVYSPFVLGCLV